jgi:hypothetical protein
MLARRSGAERRMPSRTSGAALRISIATNVASSAATRANEATVIPEPQPFDGASTTVRTSSSIAAVTVTAPAMSYRRGPVSAGRSRGITRGATARMASANGTGSRNVQRQPSSVSSPPSTRPSEKPLAPVAV